eukprot:11447298-Heterocapsa_arctica.AAC.1
MAEQHDTDCHDRTIFEAPWQNDMNDNETTDETERSVETRDPRGTAALAASDTSLGASLSLFLSSSAS